VNPDPDAVPSAIGTMTDDDFREMIRRALRTVLILGPVLFLVFTFTMGWQSGLLELGGAVISWTGIREWRSLALTVFSKLDNQLPARPLGRTLVTFFLRLAVVGAILYVSLRFLRGSVYALIAGIGLAAVALSIEAVRLLRN
jgi:hypothetical protein